MSKKELNYNRFVDPNILGSSRLVHSDLRIYRIAFFLLDITDSESVNRPKLCNHCHSLCPQNPVEDGFRNDLGHCLINDLYFISKWQIYISLE